MGRLRSFLAGMQPGAIQEASDLEHALADCWDEFDGDPGGMGAYKLHGRMEKAEWQPPVLTFQIARHGGAALGSSRAAIQSWTLDIELGTREWCQSGHRQIRRMQPRLSVKPLAEEIARFIRNRQEDPRLKWYEDGSVRVLIGQILPEGASSRQTCAGRRSRFWDELDDLLGPDWERRRQSYSRRAE